MADTHNRTLHGPGIQYFDGTRVTMQYDPLNRLTTSVDWGGNTTFAFNGRSDLVGKTDPGAIVQAYALDGDRNRTKLTDPDLGIITSTFDSLNRVASTQKQTGQIYTPVYDPDGRRTTLQMGAGSIRAFAFDRLGRLTTQIEYAGTSPIATLSTRTTRFRTGLGGLRTGRFTRGRTTTTIG